MSRLFGVTIDELFDNAPQNIDCRRAEFAKEIKETWKTGDIKTRFELATEAVTNYPGDFEFLSVLAEAEWSYGLHEMNDMPDERASLLQSSIKHAELVIENTADESLKYRALRTAFFSLNYLGRVSEAEHYASLSGDEDLIVMCLSDDEKAVRKQQCERVFADLVGRLSEPDGKIEVLNAVDAIIKAVIPDGNYLFYNETLTHNEIWRATYYAQNGELKDAISALNRAREYAIVYDRIIESGHSEKYTCPIFNHIEFNPQKILRSGTTSLCEDLVEILGRSCFDAIRANEDFKALLDLRRPIL